MTTMKSVILCMTVWLCSVGAAFATPTRISVVPPVPVAYEHPIQRQINEYE